MARRAKLALALALALALFLAGCLLAPPGAREVLTLASTTSARDTGLLDALEAAFERDTGIELRYVALGSGQAMELARRGDADVLLVHSPAAERAFVAAGHGTERRPVMFNEFLLVGPPADPAGARGEANVSRALLAVHDARAPFASRGDASGTHAKERELWALAGLDPASFARSWYKETGAGQAATLRFASESGAYALTDEGTWVRLKAEGDIPGLVLITRGDPALRNPYSVIPVSGAVHPGVRTDLAERFADWLTGPEGQGVIADFTVDGVRLFTPDARAGA